MFKKVFKGVTGLLTAAAIMAGSLGVVPVYAANTSDTTYRIYINASSDDFRGVTARDKQNDSKVYVKIDTSPTLITQVRTFGNRNTSSFWYNETRGATAYVERGVPSSITNYCYENRAIGHTYVSTMLGLRSSSSITGYVEGVWSPDSTKNYTVVN